MKFESEIDELERAGTRIVMGHFSGQPAALVCREEIVVDLTDDGSRV